ncbi:unnamed protein product, partial [Symbiodinium microadriaticum]
VVQGFAKYFVVEAGGGRATSFLVKASGEVLLIPDMHVDTDPYCAGAFMMSTPSSSYRFGDSSVGDRRGRGRPRWDVELKGEALITRNGEAECWVDWTANTRLKDLVQSAQQTCDASSFNEAPYWRGWRVARLQIDLVENGRRPRYEATVTETIVHNLDLVWRLVKLKRDGRDGFARRMARQRRRERVISAIFLPLRSRLGRELSGAPSLATVCMSVDAEFTEAQAAQDTPEVEWEFTPIPSSGHSLESIATELMTSKTMSCLSWRQMSSSQSHALSFVMQAEGTLGNWPMTFKRSSLSSHKYLLEFRNRSLCFLVYKHIKIEDAYLLKPLRVIKLEVFVEVRNALSVRIRIQLHSEASFEFCTPGDQCRRLMYLNNDQTVAYLFDSIVAFARESYTELEVSKSMRIAIWWNRFKSRQTVFDMSAQLRFRCKRRAKRQEGTGSGCAFHATWPGVLSTQSEESLSNLLEKVFSDADEVAKRCLDDGRRMSLGLAAVQLDMQQTFLHPLDVQAEMFWSEIEGPYNQRVHFKVKAVQALPEVVCAPESIMFDRQSRQQAFFRVSKMSLQALHCHVQPTLQKWVRAGVLGADLARRLIFAVAVPKGLGLAIVHRSVGFLTMSLSRKFPKQLPDYASFRSLKTRVMRDLSQLQVTSQDPESATAGLCAASFKLLAVTLDSWKDVLLRGTADDTERRDEVMQEVQMMQSWAHRLAFQLHPLQVSAAKLERSKMQQRIVGKGFRLKHSMLWGRASRVSKHRLCKSLGEHLPSQFLTGRYASWFAIHAVIFSSFLKNDEKVEPAVRHAMLVAFPKDIASDLLKAMGSVTLPSPATLARWRLLFEASCCLLMREDIAAGLNGQVANVANSAAGSGSRHDGLTFHVLIDSSPQAGRDWLLCEMHMLGHKVPLPDMLKDFWQLCSLTSQLDLDDEMQECDLESVALLEERLQSAFQVLVLCPAGLGHQRSNVHHKLHAFIHSLWLAAGQELPRVISGLASFTTDFGTEAGLAAMTAPGHLLCPQLLSSAMGSIDEGEEGAQEEPLQDIDFRHAFQIPGGHHILHNLCQDVCDVLPGFKTYKHQMQAIAAFLGDKHIRDALQHKCFGEGIAFAYHALFDSFNAHLIDWRWQSLSDFLAAVEPLEEPLRRFWDVSMFVPKRPAAASNARPDAEPEPVGDAPAVDAAQEEDLNEEGAEASLGQQNVQAAESQVEQLAVRSVQAAASRGLVRACRFDEAVRDEKLWEYMAMLRILLRIPDLLLAWLQSCPCHGNCNAREHDATGSSRSTKAECPKHACIMKGRRAPELAAGFISDFMTEKLEAAVTMYPAQSELYHDYVTGLKHISFLLQMKFSFWTRLPYALLALSHPTEDVARNSARRLLGEWERLAEEARVQQHPLAKEFLQDSGAPHLRDLLVRFACGSISRCSDEFQPVRARLASWSFAPLLERSIEGRHAVAQRASVRAPNHSGAYISSALRMPACVEAIEADPQVLVRLEKHFSSVRLPVFVLRHLGLMQTLSVRALDSLDTPQRNKFLQDSGFVDRVMFRLDASTQFAKWEKILRCNSPSSRAKQLQNAGMSVAASDMNALQRHLALEHFRALHNSEDYFAAVLPEDVSAESAVEFPFRALNSMLAESPACSDAYLADDGSVLLFEADEDMQEAATISWGHRAQTDVALVNADDPRLSRVALFKVEKWQPSLLKQIKGTIATRLTSSDIAVTLFPVVSVVFLSEDKILCTSGVPQGPEGSFAGAVAMVNEALFTCNVFKFDTLPNRVFRWQGPLHGNSQKDMDAVVEALMLAGGTPGSEKAFMCPSLPSGRRKSRKTAGDAQTKLLHEMATRGWVQCRNQGWLFTEAGYMCVNACVGLRNPVSVLEPRRLHDRSSWTRFEIMHFLRARGWVALPLPKKKKGLELCLALSDGDGHDAAPDTDDVGPQAGRTWYFSCKPPLVSKHYLQAMLAVQEHRQALISKGLKSVSHVAPVAYYKCLVDVALGTASVAQLADMLPSDKPARSKALRFEMEEPEVLALKELIPVPKPEDTPLLSYEELKALYPPPGEEDVRDIYSPSDFSDPAGVESGMPDSAVSPDGLGPALPPAASSLDTLDPPADPGLPPAEEEAAFGVDGVEKLERRRREKTHRWGLFLVTYKVQQPSAKAIKAAGSRGAAKIKYSWQATCTMPQHNQKLPGQAKVSKCTKTMGFDAEDPNAEQVALWRIRHWCNSCVLFATKQEHQEFHPTIDDLPDEEAITASKVEAFLPPEGIPEAASEAEPTRKRKRNQNEASNDSESESSSSSSSQSDSSSSS